LVAFSREQLAQKLSPQDPSMFQGMFDIRIGMIAFEQHWLAPLVCAFRLSSNEGRQLFILL